MATVTVSAQAIAFPPACVCCGGAHVGHSIQAIAARPDEQRVLVFPSCGACAGHDGEAGTARSRSCAKVSAVAYVGWQKSAHTFAFASPAYAAAFLDANVRASKKAWGDVQAAPLPWSSAEGAAGPLVGIPTIVHVPRGAPAAPATRPLTKVLTVVLVGAILLCAVSMILHPPPLAPSSTAAAPGGSDAAAATSSAGESVPRPPRHDDTPRPPAPVYVPTSGGGGGTYVHGYMRNGHYVNGYTRHGRH